MGRLRKKKVEIDLLKCIHNLKAGAGEDFKI